MLKDCVTPNGWLQHKLHDFKIGDILWVRESFGQDCFSDFHYKASDVLPGDILKWKPSIHMPKEAARIFLEITNIRIERLQDISEEDAISEGIEIIGHSPNKIPIYREYFLKDITGCYAPENSFRSLWKKINGEDSWNANPWVWVYEFKVVEKPKDFIHE